MTTNSAAREAVLLRLAAVRAAYAAQLRNKVSELSGAIDQCRDAGSGWQEAQRLAHSIAGTASVLGMGAVGLAAREIEALLAEIGYRPEAVPMTNLAKRMQLLRHEADAVAGGG